MAYHLELDEIAVAPYLLGLGLSPEGREALLRCLTQLAESADTFLRGPDWRLAPGSVHRPRPRRFAGLDSGVSPGVR